jgi:hypothetical protein
VTRIVRWIGAALSVVALSVAALAAPAVAVADDHDDDERSRSRGTSGTQMWPPTTIAWPPLAPPPVTEHRDPVIPVN